ncbi:MAG: response regulator, partial [Lachnospiraceae bacterium]|nr:response regulator [Lachnospiraceae bacterium]
HSNLDEVRFLLNNKGIAFDAKLILLILSVAVPFMVLANYYAQYYIAVPVSELSEKLQEFTTAEPDEKVQLLEKLQDFRFHTKDEIGTLYESVDQMAVGVLNYVDQVKREQELQEDLRVAQKASETKSAFLSNVSHELRTPINAVLGMDEMILRESREPDIVGYATDIQTAGRSLLGLVNDILDSSKLEAGKMDIIPVQYDLSSTINDLVNMISTKASDKDLEFVVDVKEEIPCMLYGDEIRIKQVILNILTNAVKYTNEGKVTLSVDFEKVSEDAVDLLVHVKDTGIGIKEEDLSKLFQRFERIEEERNRNIEGTGLGMSIVNNLLALMDSHLDVDSVYGEGSDFSFRLRQQVVEWKPIGSLTEMFERAKSQNVVYHERFHAPNARILVVDDTPMNHTVMKGLLKQTKIQIDTADSGFEMLRLIKNIKYDLIFLDHRMPQMDGIETLEKMRQMSEHLNVGVPVIALTANAISGVREKYLEAGFTDFMSKPVEGAKLEAMLEQYLPKELLEYDTAAELKTEEPKAEESVTESTHLSPLAGITSIDYEAAIRNCGSEDILMEVMTEFITV